MSTVWEQVEELENHVADLEAKLSAKSIEVAEARERESELQTKLKDLEGDSAEKLKAMKADLKLKISQLSALSSTIENLKTTKGQKEATVSDLEAKKAQFQAQLDESNAQIAAQEAAIQQLETKAETDSQELENLENRFSELQTELKDKTDKLAEVADAERKCSREYIAFEKAKLKREAAKKVAKKDKHTW